MGLIDQLREFRLASRERTRRRWAQNMERRQKIKNGEPVEESNYQRRYRQQRERRTERMDDARKNRAEIRALTKGPKTTRQRVVEYTSSGIAVVSGIILVETNTWPTTSIRNWGSFMDKGFLGDFPLFFVVSFLIYLVLSPIRIYFLKRFIAKKQETNETPDILDQ